MSAKSNITESRPQRHSLPDSPSDFYPVMTPPFGVSYRVIDLSTIDHFTDSLGESAPHTPYTIGRFNEIRTQLYSQPLFESEAGRRCVHMGIDLGAPAGAEVFSFDRGELYAQGPLSSNGDYGHTIVIEYTWRGETPLPCGEAPLLRGERYWALYGHLSADSTQHLEVGQAIERGQLIGWLGDQHENGGWPPHLHFQLSRVAPRANGHRSHDMPGAVTIGARSEALSVYPDPRGVLGELY